MKRAFMVLLAALVFVPDVALSVIPKDTLTTIRTRKSVRNYINKPVSRESLDTLVKAGMAAPTAGDKRPWAFVVVTEKDRLIQLSGALPYAKMLTQAGAAIVVCGIPSESVPGIEEYWIQDCSAATENILLAAEAIGLGAVWIGVYPIPDQTKKVRSLLSLPETAIPLNVISIGYPVGIEQPKNKYDPQKIHWNSW